MKFQAVLMIVFVASAYQAIVIAVDTPPAAAASDATTPNTTDPAPAPIPPVTTVIPDANTTAAPNVTTTKPETTTVTTPPTTSSTTTTTTPKPTTTAAPTTVAPNTTTTIAPSTTTTHKPDPAQPCRRFDGPSFIGGIVLTVGLIAIGCVAHKIYKSKFDRNYHTL